jgi:hypothetical protein
MIFVPAGYQAGNVMFGVEHAKGGSPWGAGTLAGPDGSRQPSEGELEAACVQVRAWKGGGAAGECAGAPLRRVPARRAFGRGGVLLPCLCLTFSCLASACPAITCVRPAWRHCVPQAKSFGQIAKKLAA